MFTNQDRWSRGGRLKQRSVYHDDPDEGEYHEPEEPVTRFPSPRPLHSVYADKNSGKETPFHSENKDFKHVLDTPPRLPKRPPGSPAPTVNRDLKPGRREKVTSARQSKTFASNEMTTRIPQRQVRSRLHDCFDHTDHDPPSRPPPCAPVQTPHISTRTAADGASLSESENQINSRLTGLRIVSSYRHSLDLESHEQDLRYMTDQSAGGRGSGRQMNHEWPQVKADSESASYTGHRKPVEASTEQEWYVGSYCRVEAEHALHLVNREGAFLVRNCSRNTTHEPYVLAIFYDNRVFNVQIRFCQVNSKYTLGTRIKTDDVSGVIEAFDSVAEIIKFHSIFPILLIDGRNPSAVSTQQRQCVLMHPVTTEDMRRLLS